MDSINDYRKADLDLFYINAIEMLKWNDEKYDYMIVDKFFSLIPIVGEKIIKEFIEKMKESGLSKIRILTFIERISMNYSILASIIEDETDAYKNIYNNLYSVVETI